jgi:hypothetical protein
MNAIDRLGGFAGLGPAVLPEWKVVAGVFGQEPRCFGSINDACRYAETIPVQTSSGIRCTIICTGLFNEQVTLPNDVNIRGSGMGQFDWTYTGDRTARNWTCKFGYNNYIEDCRFFLTGNETDECVISDDSSRYCHLLNVHFLSAIPPGGDAISRGDGRSRAILITGTIWPRTFLGWNVLIDADGAFVGNNAAVRIINTGTDGNGVADIRFWTMNVDTLFSDSGCGIYIENLQDVWFISPQLLGKASSPLDRIMRVSRTVFSGSGRNVVQLAASHGSGWTSPIEVNSGCAVAFDSSAGENAPVVLRGDGIAIFNYSAGGQLVRVSPDRFTSTNLALGISATSAGCVRAKLNMPPGAQSPRLFYWMQPGFVGAFNGMVDLRSMNARDDDFYTYGLAVRNPTTREIYLFGVRSGNELTLTRWTQAGPTDPVLLADANVRALRLYRTAPHLFGAFRTAGDSMTFELRDFDDTPVSVFHTLPNMGGFTEFGFAASDENAAGEGVDVNLLLYGFRGLP